jgi:hypothetical protein
MNVKNIMKYEKKYAVPCFILLISLLFLNALDVITTKLFLTFTRYLEANPIFSILLSKGDWLLPIIIKMFIVPLFFLVYLFPSKASFNCLLFINIIYIIVVSNNLLSLLLS